MFDELEQNKVDSFQEQVTENVEVPKAEEAPKQDGPREQNLRLLRERAERAEREIEELKKYREQPKQQAQEAQNSNDDDFNIEDDSYIEAKYVKKVYKKLKEVEQKLEQSTRVNQQSNAEMRLKSEFPDIMDVVTEANIKDLQAIAPDVFENLMYNPDMYKRGKLMRQAIRDNVLSEKYEAADKRLEQNKSKPRSAGTVPTQQSDTPLTRVGDYDRRILTNERKDQLMQQVRDAKENY